MTGTIKTTSNGKLVAEVAYMDCPWKANINLTDETIEINGVEYPALSTGKMFRTSAGSRVYVYLGGSQGNQPALAGVSNAAQFDAVINDGGFGYNPYRN